MLKPISRLRSICKGDLNHHANSINKQSRQNGYYSCSITRVGKRILHSIPVLSIFVLLGIMGFSTIGLPLAEPDGEVYAETLNSNTSLIIDNGELKNDNTTGDGVVYSSHIVQVKADNITGYTLSITGPVGLNGKTPISGADNNTPANMATNTWGYAWDTEVTSEESMTYASFTGDTQTITKTTNGATNNPSVSKYKVDFTRKLVFAVKFADDAATGHYTSNVTLNLTVSPRNVVYYSVHYVMNNGTGGPIGISGTANATKYTYTIPATEPTASQSGYKFDGYSTNNSAEVRYWPGDKITLDSTNSSITLYAVYKLSAFPSSLTTMQGMTPDICASVATGVSKSLTDYGRGNTSYKIQKLKDGNCWMTSNLALNLNSYTLTSSNSDVTTTYSSSSATRVTNQSDWLAYNNGGSTQAMYNINGFSSSDYNSVYGYYYSWCAATANTSGNNGTCAQYATNNQDAPNSICPKGWHLPKGGTSVATTPNRYMEDITKMTSNDFAYLRYLENGAANTDYSSWSGKYFDGPPAYFTLGGVNWYLTGSVSDWGLQSADFNGSYWSRTVQSDAGVYKLFTYKNGVLYPAQTNGQNRAQGSSIRCVAYSN